MVKSYTKIKGVKVPTKKYKAFLKGLKRKKAESGAKISPQLFSILVDKFLSNITHKRKPAVRKPKESTSLPASAVGAITSSSFASPFLNEIKKTESAIAATNDQLQRDKDAKNLDAAEADKKEMAKEKEKFKLEKAKLRIYEEKERKEQITHLQFELKKVEDAVKEKAKKEAYNKNVEKMIREKAKALGIPNNAGNKGVRSLDVIEKEIQEIDPAFRTRDQIRKDYILDHGKEIEDIEKQIDDIDNLREHSSSDSKERDSKDSDQSAKGKGRNKMASTGLSNFQIDKLMKKYGDKYLGTIAHDEIHTILDKIKPHSIGCCVINTDDHRKAGQHWQCLFWDAAKRMEICFYDSFGRVPDKTIMRGIKEISDRLDANTYLKLKVNRVCQQADSSSNCGFFCVKTLIDLLNNKHFSHATGWDDAIEKASKQGEPSIEKFKKQVGYGPWNYIKSGFKKIKDIGNEAVKRVSAAINGRQDAPPAIRQLLEKNGDDIIIKIQVIRVPVNSIIKHILNEASAGQLEQNQAKLNYDKIYHLALVINTTGKAFKLERNEDVSVGSASIPSDAEVMPVNLGGKKLILKDFINKGSNSADFWRYSADHRNCQNFCLDMLGKNGLLNEELRHFIKQDATKLLENTGLAKEIANRIPDLASRLKILVFGVGRKKKFSTRNI